MTSKDKYEVLGDLPLGEKGKCIYKGIGLWLFSDHLSEVHDTENSGLIPSNSKNKYFDLACPFWQKF